MPDPTTTTARPRGWPAAVLVGLFLVAAIPIMVWGGLPGRPGWDQYNFHEPIIRAFKETWPRADASNYLSATTPLYHWVLAAVARYISDSRVFLQLAASLFSVGLIALVARACTRALPERPGLTLLVCLPFVASMFVFPAGVWLLPDNAGWLGVLVVWLLALRPGWTATRALAASAVLVLLVLTRQIHIWAAALVWTGAWLGADGPRAESEAILPVDLLRPSSDRLRRTAIAFLLTLPAFAAVAYYVALWGGLVVPRFQGFYKGWGPTTPDFGLTLLAIYSVFFAPWLGGPAAIGRLIRGRSLAMIVASILGLIAAIYPESTYSFEDGRYGGLWNVVRRLPDIADRSVIMLVGAPVGAAALVLWLSQMAARDRVVMLAAFIAFEAAQCACSQTWQRYSEPMLLMFVIFAAVRTPAARAFGTLPALIRAAMIAGPAVLFVGFGALTAAGILRGADASTLPREPLTSPHYRGPPEPTPREYTEEPLPGGPR